MNAATPPASAAADPASRTLPLTRKDFTSDQEVRWCPGCGDYVILAAVQGLLPELGIAPKDVVFISGIGCSSRFPYYLDTYGMHSIHGRAPAIATGLATARDGLSVWVVTGDGDALSIGGNHLIHALRRNVNLKILLFNNRIYGLTKGQASPTSQAGTVTKSTPSGSVDRPFDPVCLALGAEATFVARTLDSDREHLTETLRAAAHHRGSALVEIYQNCPIFNDGAFDHLTGAGAPLVRLRHREPILLGAEGRAGVVRDPDTGEASVVELTPETQPRVVVHDEAARTSAHAFAMTRLATDGGEPVTAIGVFRRVTVPTYDDQVREQVAEARRQQTRSLQSLIAGTDTWTVA